MIPSASHPGYVQEAHKPCEFAISKFEGLGSSLIEAPPFIQEKMLGEILAKKFFVVKNYSTIFGLFKKVAKGVALAQLESLERSDSLASKAPKSPFLNPDFSLAFDKDRKFIFVNLFSATNVNERAEFFTELPKIIVSAAQALKVLNEAGFLYLNPALGMNRVNTVWKLNLIGQDNNCPQLLGSKEDHKIIHHQVYLFAKSFFNFIEKFNSNHPPKITLDNGVLKLEETADVWLINMFFDSIVKKQLKNLSWDPIIDCFSDFNTEKLLHLRDQLL